MNREIKFRVWTGTTMEYKVMAGYLGHFYVAGMDEKDAACMSPFNTIYSKETPVMQYTGLKDRNGKEIYEGDLLLCSPETAPDYARYVVFLEGEYWLLNPDNKNAFPLTVVVSSHQDSIIIGNVYENPDLLK